MKVLPDFPAVSRSPAHLEPDRERVSHRASSDRADERIVVAKNSQAHGLQARLRGGKDLAAIEGRKSVAQDRARRQIPNGVDVIEMPANHAA